MAIMQLQSRPNPARANPGAAARGHPYPRPASFSNAGGSNNRANNEGSGQIDPLLYIQSNPNVMQSDSADEDDDNSNASLSPSATRMSRRPFNAARILPSADGDIGDGSGPSRARALNYDTRLALLATFDVQAPVSDQVGAASYVHAMIVDKMGFQDPQSQEYKSARDTVLGWARQWQCKTVKSFKDYAYGVTRENDFIADASSSRRRAWLASERGFKPALLPHLFKFAAKQIDFERSCDVDEDNISDEEKAKRMRVRTWLKNVFIYLTEAQFNVQRGDWSADKAVKAVRSLHKSIQAVKPGDFVCHAPAPVNARAVMPEQQQSAEELFDDFQLFD